MLYLMKLVGILVLFVLFCFFGNKLRLSKMDFKYSGNFGEFLGGFFGIVIYFILSMSCLLYGIFLVFDLLGTTSKKLEQRGQTNQYQYQYQNQNQNQNLKKQDKSPISVSKTDTINLEQAVSAIEDKINNSHNEEQLKGISGFENRFPLFNTPEGQVEAERLNNLINDKLMAVN